LNREQILEVANCQIQALASERYPDSIDTSHLLESFSPASDCDWAILAYDYAIRTEADWHEQQTRLSHARTHADLYLDTDKLSIEEVLGEVVEFVKGRGSKRTRGSKGM
jgi:hypothetical protein